MKATLVFDRLEDKKTHMISPLSAVVTAVAKAETNARAVSGEDQMMTAPSQPTSAQPRTSQQNGGLLGGVAQTVGGVAGQVNSTVNSTPSATLGTSTGVSGAAGTLTGGAIQIVSDTTANATSRSTLAVSDRNSTIESGTQFVLQTTSALKLVREPKQK